MSSTGKWRQLCFAAAVAGLLPCFAHAEPQNNWWWNPDESGRGFFIEVQEGLLFMAAYFYADDGRGTWVVSSGTMTDADTYDGRLLSVSGGQTLIGDYHVPTPPNDVGAIALRFTDSTHGTLTWPGGVVRIEREVFGGSDILFQPSGWWWNPDESGRGFSIEVQGDTLFLAAFMYDGSGNPLWYISSGKMSTPTHFHGVLQQVSGGQTMGGPYKFPSAIVNIGAITIDFVSLEEATLILSDDVAGALHVEQFKMITIKPELRRKGWNGPIHQEVTTVDGGGTTTATWQVNDVVFVQNVLRPRGHFEPTGTYTISVKNTTDICTYSASISGKFRIYDSSQLVVNADRTFTGRIQPDDQPITLVFSCPGLPTPPSITVPSIAYLELGIPMIGVLTPTGSIYGKQSGPNSWIYDLAPR